MSTPLARTVLERASSLAKHIYQPDARDIPILQALATVAVAEELHAIRELLEKGFEVSRGDFATHIHPQPQG